MAVPVARAAAMLFRDAVSMPRDYRRDVTRAMQGIDINFEVLGDKQLQRRLNQLEPKVARKVARKALRKGAKRLAKEVKRRAPVVSGDLRRSVRVRAGKRTGRGGRNAIGVDLVVGANMPTFYASFPELGTEYQEEQRFIRQSADDLRGEILNDIADELGRGIAAEAALNV